MDVAVIERGLARWAQTGPDSVAWKINREVVVLLRWVQATLLAVLPRAYQLYVGPLSRAEREQYCREATGMGPLLGAPEGFFPDSLPALEGYIDEMLASRRIVVTPTARALAREVL